MSGKAQYRVDTFLGLILFIGMPVALYMALIGAPTMPGSENSSPRPSRR